jgi:hypothetical protein
VTAQADQIIESKSTALLKAQGKSGPRACCTTSTPT